MPTRKSVRVVLYASPDLVMRYVRLAERYGLARSEAYRLALERAYSPMLAWLKRTRPDVDSLAGASAVGAVGAGDSARGAKVEPSPLAALERYAAQLVARDEVGRDQLRMMLLTQADILGMNLDEARALVDVLVEDVLSTRSAPGAPSGGDAPAPSTAAAPLQPGESQQQPLPVSAPVRVDLD